MMNKNVTAVFAAVCGLVMVSCDTPKDLRPGEKVSVDYVEPGTRNTFNIGNVNEVHPMPHREGELMPNHDHGANTIQPSDSVAESATINPAGTVKPNNPATH